MTGIQISTIFQCESKRCFGSLYYLAIVLSFVLTTNLDFQGDVSNLKMGFRVSQMAVCPMVDCQTIGGVRVPDSDAIREAIRSADSRRL